MSEARFILSERKQMLKLSLYLSLTAALCFLSYKYGTSNAKIEIIEKQVEIIKYEKNEVSKIMAKPNLDDDNIIKLFDNGTL